MPALFSFENVQGFLNTFGLTMYDGYGWDRYPFKEKEDFMPHLYCKRLWLYDEKKNQYTPARIKVEFSAFEVVQYKGYGTTSYEKVFDLSEKWQKFMLETEGKTYAHKLIYESKENKHKLMDALEKYEKTQKKIDKKARKEVTKKLAQESKKQMLALMFLKGEQSEVTYDEIK